MVGRGLEVWRSDPCEVLDAALEDLRDVERAGSTDPAPAPVRLNQCDGDCLLPSEPATDIPANRDRHRHHSPARPYEVRVLVVVFPSGVLETDCCGVVE